MKLKIQFSEKATYKIPQSVQSLQVEAKAFMSVSAMQWKCYLNKDKLVRANGNRDGANHSFEAKNLKRN